MFKQRCSSVRIIAVTLVCVFALFGARAHAQLGKVASPQLVVTAAAADATYIYIDGVNFGGGPLVFLGGFPLGGVMTTGGGTRITALNPAFPPGTYLLHVSSGNGAVQNGTFNLTLGATGTPGSSGEQGPQGPTGPQGEIGATGPAGADGAAGAPCLASDPACRGPNGENGVNGTNGADGTKGIDGTNGLDGTNGAPGAACLPSDPACVGPQGVAGPPGPQGLTGATGPAGADGAAGTNGTNGTVGPQGGIGPQGPAGAAGGGALTLASLAGTPCGVEGGTEGVTLVTYTTALDSDAISITCSHIFAKAFLDVYARAERFSYSCGLFGGECFFYAAGTITVSPADLLGKTSCVLPIPSYGFSTGAFLCRFTFAPNTAVTVTATTPDVFDGWINNPLFPAAVECAGTTGAACTFTLGANRYVYASFGF